MRGGRKRRRASDIRTRSAVVDESPSSQVLVIESEDETTDMDANGQSHNTERAGETRTVHFKEDNHSENGQDRPPRVNPKVFIR